MSKKQESFLKVKTSNEASSSIEKDSSSSVGDLVDVATGVEKSKRRSQIKRSPSPTFPEGQYEVESVEDYTKDETGEMYFIKWKNWEEEFNTWEPTCNLINCEEALLKFYLTRKALVEGILDQSEYVTTTNGHKRRRGPPLKMLIPPDPRPFEVRVQEFFDATIPVSEEEIQEFQEYYLRTYKKKKDNRWPITKINKFLQDGVDGKLSEESIGAVRQQLMFHELDRRKENVKIEIKKWEHKMNSISQGRPQIIIENDVDLCGPPSNFDYINDYITGIGVNIPNDPPVGCACDDLCYENRKACCPDLFGSQFAYTSTKKIRVGVGTPIYECNRKCKCGPECPNRVVQDGSTDHKLCIFRTANGCGWGVKTTKTIKKGTFVALYVGEIINTEEAERRGRTYDEEGVTYLFDLDFNEQDSCPYTIDAAKHGNIAHFINHSCNPNLGVYAVWVNCLDPNLPKLALFAIRDIGRNEEITFDYKNQLSAESRATADANDGSTVPIPSRHKPCMCGEANCRGILF